MISTSGSSGTARQHRPPRRGIALPDEEVAEDDAVAAEQLAGHELVAFGRLDASLSCGATRILLDAIGGVPPPERPAAGRQGPAPTGDSGESAGASAGQ